MNRYFLLIFLVLISTLLHPVEITIFNNYHAHILIIVITIDGFSNEILLHINDQKTVYLETFIDFLQITVPSKPYKKSLCLSAPYQNPSSILSIYTNHYNNLDFSSDNLREQ